jgi:hypothetical protein
MKNIITVLSSEKDLYRIFKELEKHGRSNFSYQDLDKHRGIARKIGIRGKQLVERGLLIPPLSSTNKHRVTGVQLPIGVKIEEKKTFNGSRFFFHRRK